MQTSHFAQINNLLTSNPSLEQFKDRLHSSPIRNNRYYLGLLLMSIVSMPLPKIQCIRVLLKCGADVNFMEPSEEGGKDIGKSVLMIACEKSVNENVKYLLGREELQVGAVDSCGENALHYALRNEREEEAVKIIGIILKEFPHLINSGHSNFLFSAIETQKLKVVGYLLENYVDPNEQTQPVGLTPLQYTISLTGQIASQAIIQILSLLLKFNADPKKQNYLNEDSYDYADKYLFQLEELVASQKTKRTEEKEKVLENKCFTVCTYEDSRASLEKDEEIPRSDANGIDIKEQQLDLGESFEFECESSEESERDQTIEEFHLKLSQDIQVHSESYLAQHSQAYQDITPLYQFLYNLGQELELKLQIIGSFATGLWTRFSDVDFVFINQKSTYVHIGKKLEQVHRRIRVRSRELGIVQMFLNLEISFPNIKIKLNQDLNERRIEIGIFQRKCSGRKYVQFINENIYYYPIIVPIFFFLHHLLQTFQLHRPTKNGLKTYTIFLVILAALQKYPSQSISISQALVWLIYYYNNCYQYRYQTQKDESGPGRAIFNMMDPLNMTNNTGGKETNTQRLILMFKTVGYAIGERLKDLKANGTLEEVFELYKMFQ